MDAHNAAESDQTKPAGASPQHQPPKSPDAKPPKDAPAVTSNSPGKETRPRASSTGASGDQDSDAETIVLPGKDGHSPSKVRKVRQEDRSDGDNDASKRSQKATTDSVGETHNHGDKEGEAAIGHSDGNDDEKKRSSDAHEKEKGRDRVIRPKDESSVLSSAPTSPPQNRRRRRSVNSRSSLSDTDQHAGDSKPSKTLLREKFKSGERLVPHKRKSHRTDSDEEDDDSRKARRQRTTSAGVDSGRLHKERRQSTSSRQHYQDTRNRSNSPPSRAHRRSVSTQLASSNGSGMKKRRPPPPLQPTDYRSDDSSASGSPHPRSSKTRSAAASSHAESHASPMKMPSHKKHLDAHGQTLLARACARGEFEGAKQRLADRPEDLNVADYAGNTPLQIAAINGCEDIVELLVDAGCNLDCVNYDKDTPLLDAVDNGHLGVIKLLLDAGVNPRKANVNGEEPIDRVTDETDNADEIRAALTEAKKRFGGRTKTSEDRNSHLDSHEGPDSPRQSPAALPSNRRGGAVRSTKTRNDLLYQPLDDKTLRQAAGRGDEEMVARILQVKGSCSDAEPMVAAARGGHDLVIQLLLGLGGADPDPDPVHSQPSDFATPILAAIGQENIKVLELLLEQQSVDPTRRHNGEAYYEIAKRRQGTNWKEEEQILKNAYDAFKSSSKPIGKLKSPGRREREREREEKRARRAERAEARPPRAEPASPPREGDSRKKAPGKVSSPREKRRSESHLGPGDEKRNLVRPKKDERPSSVNPSDRELSPVSHMHNKTKRTESDMVLSSEGENVKPRRKLISKGELRGEREKQRRSSVTSTTSTLKEPSSPRESRHEDPAEKDKIKVSEKYHDRAKALKREESRDPASTGDASVKRHRTSVTPERSHNSEKDEGEVPVKRRRIEGEPSEKRSKRPSSSAEEGVVRRTGSGSDGTGRTHPKSHERKEGDGKNGSGEPQRKEPRRSSGPETSIKIKSEDVDVEMLDADNRNVPESSKTTSDAGGEPERKKKKKAQHADDEDQKEAERKRVEIQEKKRKQQLQDEARAKKQREEEEVAQRKRKEEEEREVEKKRQEEAERKKKQEEEEEAKKLAEEKVRQEAEEKARREEEEKRRAEEEARKEEEERQKREEEERLRKEREAAEEVRRKREEEERKERERRDRLHREEMEKKRAAREAELRRLREEQERERLDKLPPLLRWLDTCPNPKNPAFAEKFRTIQGVRYDTIRPEANRTPEGREQWVLNTHAALLLGEKDLDLSRCKCSPPKAQTLNPR